MKFIRICMCLLFFFQFSYADISQTTKERIAELEQEIESTKQVLQELKKDKNTHKTIIKKLEKNITTFKNIIKNLNEHKISNEQELEEILADINQCDNNISENQVLLNKLINNLIHLYVKSIYQNHNSVRNSYINELQICSNSILVNLDSLYFDYLKKIDISKEKEQDIQTIQNNMKYNQQNFNYAASQKKDEQDELNLLDNLEKDYQNQINSMKDGITSLEDFLEQIEAERHGREYSFKFAQDIIWPLTGTVIQEFGIIKPNNSKTTIENKGICIQTKIGSPVKSIASGIVAFSGWFENKGNLVIIDHQNGFFSLYGYNEKLIVNKSQRVEQGHIIAYSGSNLIIGENCLYFELRKAGKAVDPLDYLR